MIYALTYAVADSYGVGDHEEILEVFADQETADRVRWELLGRQRDRHSRGVWGPWDELTVVPWAVR